MLQESYIEREAIVDPSRDLAALVPYWRVNYADNQTLVAVLRGQEFLIITLSLTTPPEAHTNIVKAASEAGVLYIMPNVYGSDIQNEELRKEDLYSD
ncbi:hypothetical protein EYZ11_011600 [Aspergillus tanneri]|uniref:NmrA-like domain-containing protein n=1 Tax=Aspergillus tanneri TaxID=1220188 RepID=A0A4S3J2F2_9EURO|nr:hypothetical protein EYZ11_011600 [Aspergillus tanneri]